jgi:hypothetical protein
MLGPPAAAAIPAGSSDASWSAGAGAAEPERHMVRRHSASRPPHAEAASERGHNRKLLATRCFRRRAVSMLGSVLRY